MIAGTSGVDLIGFVVYAVAAGTAAGLFTLIWRAGHTRGRLEAELACCQAKGTDDVKGDTTSSYQGLPVDYYEVVDDITGLEAVTDL